MAKNKKIYEDDDGRVIAPMNVEGMPWYNKRQPKSQKEANIAPQLESMSKKESRRMILRLYLAFLPVIAVFFGVFAVVIWLFTKM